MSNDVFGLRFKDNDEEALVQLAGEDGAAVLDGAALAADDLAAAGLTAKDADDVQEGEPVAEEVESVEAETTEVESENPDDGKVVATHDLEAMKQTLDDLKKEKAEQEAAAAEESTENPELVELREAVKTLRAEVNSLLAERAAFKDMDVAFKDMLTKIASLATKAQLVEDVTARLFDLVLGYERGSKEIVVERNGDPSAHDPDLEALQKQAAKMVADDPSIGSTDTYAGTRMFGEKES